MNDFEPVQTRLFTVDPAVPDAAAIAEAARVLRGGRLVAFPTETVYGLGANALDAAAIRRIYAAKQRPATDPVIAHIHKAGQLNTLAIQVPDAAYALADAFWPGPLTFVLRRAPDVPANIAAGRDTVAVRMPAHPVAQALLEAADVPIGAPSANRFSRPSPTRAAHVMADLAGYVDVVLDGGDAMIGIESTILDLTAPQPVVLRPGGIPLETLREILPDVAYSERYLPENVVSAPSPGTLAKHYSPEAEVRLYRGDDPSRIIERMQSAAQSLIEAGKRPGILALDGDAPHFNGLNGSIVLLGQTTADFANHLFAGLRDLDAQEVDVILVRAPEREGLGLAVWDRLLRAAEGQVIEVK